LTFSR